MNIEQFKKKSKSMNEPYMININIKVSNNI